MTTMPIAGVHYCADFTAKMFIAPGRPGLPFSPLGTLPGRNAGADPNAAYPLPESNFAIWDPTNGDDTGTGTEAAPVRTLAAAMSKIVAGGTIVIRGGVHSGTPVGYKIASASGYNAALGFGGLNVAKKCTLQPYPGERVILDGTRDESGGWTADSGTWSKDISITIDRGATDSYGRLDNDSRGIGWLWVRTEEWRQKLLAAGYTSQAAEAFPLASWNEQVWINDTQQKQVASLAEVGPGKFYVAGTTGGTNGVLFTSTRYYLGTDPTGKDVRVGELNTSLRLSQAGSVLRGVTLRRFCGSNHMGGVVKGGAPNLVFENVIIEDASAQGHELYQQASGCTMRRVDAIRAGNTGFKYAGSSYNLTYDKVRAIGCNSHRYNWSPVSGGLKGVVGRNVLIKDSAFTDNYSKGVWFDVSNYDVTIVNSALDRNEENGAVFEIGAKGLIANCTLVGNGTHSVLVLDNDAVRIWNCTISDSGRLKNQVYDAKNPRHLKIYSDNRRVVDSPPGGPGTGIYPNYGRDSAQPVPDPTMNNWLIQSVEMKNCVLAATPNVQFAFLPIEDLQKSQNASRDFSDYGISADGNLYNRLATNNPAWAFLLPLAGNTQTILQGANALAQWRTATQQDAASVEVIGPSVVDADGMFTPAARALYAKGGPQCPAVPLPADVAELIGKPVGDRHVGAYPN